MARLRYNLVETALSASIDDTTTTIPLAAALQEGGVNIPSVVAPDTLAIRIGSEILSVTAYTSGATSLTADRGQEDTVNVEHFAGDAIKHVITKEDVSDSGGGGGFSITVAASNSSSDDQAAADFVCDGTNDDVTFQSIIDAYATVPLRINVAQGTYNIDAQIDVDNTGPVWIVGAAGTPWDAGVRPLFVKTTSGNYSVFRPTTAADELSLIGIHVTDEASDTSTDPLIEVPADTRLFLEDVWVESWNISGPGVGVVGNSASLEVNRCRIQGNEQAVELTAAITNATVILRDSYLYGDTQNSFEALGLSSLSVTIDNCEFEGGVGCVRIDGTGPTFPIVRVNNGQFTSNAGECLYLSDIQIMTVHGGDYDATGGSLLRLSNIDGGIIEGIYSDISGRHGIWLLDGEGVHITGNRLFDYSADTTATYHGILLDGDTNNCSVVGNTLFSPDGLNGIRVDDSTCDNNYVHGNNLYGSAATNGNEVVDNGTNTRGQEVLLFSLGDETTAITTGQKLSVRFPFNFVLSRARASLNTASAASGPFTIDVEEGGTSVFTTDLLEIDDTELTSVTAATQPNITGPYIAADAIVTFDVDDAGDGNATGAKVALVGWRI